MTTKKTRGRLEKSYGRYVSPDLISVVTDAVLERAFERQNRPQGVSYPIVLFDALRVMVLDEGFIRNEAVYLALDIQADGTKFWFRVMSELRTRGVNCATNGLLPHCRPNTEAF